MAGLLCGTVSEGEGACMLRLCPSIHWGAGLGPFDRKFDGRPAAGHCATLREGASTLRLFPPSIEELGLPIGERDTDSACWHPTFGQSGAVALCCVSSRRPIVSLKGCVADAHSMQGRCKLPQSMRTSPVKAEN